MFSVVVVVVVVVFVVVVVVVFFTSSLLDTKESISRILISAGSLYHCLFVMLEIKGEKPMVLSSFLG